MQKYQTPRCEVCHKSSIIELNEEKVAAWLAGVHVQNAFPEMPAAQRELLISGTHPACWDELFAGVED